MNFRQIEESFGKETGSPTLTLKLQEEERMISWAGFLSGRFRDGKITLEFQDWILVVTGRELEPLWQAFQMQDVQWIRMIKAETSKPWHDECAVLKIQLIDRET